MGGEINGWMVDRWIERQVDGWMDRFYIEPGTHEQKESDICHQETYVCSF